MKLKKRRRIVSLLDRYCIKKEHVEVTIRGSQTNLVLYEGPLLHVPYLLCTEYVKSYKYVQGHLEIISTCDSSYAVESDDHNHQQ